MSKKIFSLMLLALLVFSGCVSSQKKLTPTQRLFTLQAEFNALQDEAAELLRKT